MKKTMWDEDKIKILEDTPQAREQFGYCYGAHFIELTDEMISALNNGKCIGATVNCEEYSIFLRKENSADSAL